MSKSNPDLIASVMRFIDQFVAGLVGVEEVQTKLQTTMGLLERGPGNLAAALRLAEADLEEIRFTLLLQEQRPAAIFRLDTLRAELEAGLAKEEG
jgi:hypothetical protein